MALVETPTTADAVDEMCAASDGWPTVRSSMNVKCPYCKRALVNRMVDRCLYCERVLPEALCLSEEDKRRLRLASLRELEEKHQARLKKDIEERERWNFEAD